jgi:hypothetical protein
MSTPLLPDALWNLIHRCCDPHRADQGRQTSFAGPCLVSREFCSSCIAEYHGRCCGRNWAAVSGTTCCRRLRDWQQAGIGQLILVAGLAVTLRGD